MEKVEKFIQKNTRKYSNLLYRDYIGGFDKFVYLPWITTDDARKVAEIAREETIKEVCEWIKKNVYSYTWCEFQQHERGVETDKLIEDLKKHLKDKL